MSTINFDRLVDHIDEKRLLELERTMVRLRSPTFEEGPLADFLFDHMRKLGLEVEMMDVPHPTEPGRCTRQPIGRLRGEGGGPTLMLNGHMDPVVSMTGWTVDPLEGKFEDGWVWGAGAHDDKGGLCAALSAVEAIRRADVRLKGDVLVCAVAAHKMGGIGTRALLKAGLTADCCINLEHAANTIATVVTGAVRIKLVTRSPGLFFRFSEAARAAYFNAIEQQAEILRRLGPSLLAAGRGSWMTFTPHSDLPNFPMHRVDRIHKDHYGRECTMFMQVRTVPGQTLETLRADLDRLLSAIGREYPAFDCEVTMPADGRDDPHYVEPCEIPRTHPLVRALSDGQRRAANRDPMLGGALRIGNVGDGNILAAAGIPSVQYGPGDIRIYAEWPTPDERVELRELVEAARAIAYAICEVCG